MLFLLSLSLSTAFASDRCSLWELDHGYSGADCSMATNYDYQQNPGAASAGTLGLEWTPKCVDGTSTCTDIEAVRCIDGSPPAYHAEFTGSDDWVIYLQGGGSCSKKMAFDPTTGILTRTAKTWDDCDADYQSTEKSEMTSDGVALDIVGKGILSPDINNTFAGANRIKIHKCSYDRMTGTSTKEVYTAAGGEDAVLYFHGRRIVRAVLSDLALQHGLDSTDRVLFAGNSGGSGGLIFAIDKYADHIASDLALPDVEVKALFDARLKPSVENEAAFDAATPGSTAFDHDAHGTSDISATDSMDFYPLTYRKQAGKAGPTRAQYEVWYASTADRDDTCAAAHPSAPWRCYDEGHVLANHVETPFFMSHSLRDGNHAGGNVFYAEHTDAGGAVTYGTVKWEDLCSDDDIAAGRAPGGCYGAYSDRAYEFATALKNHHSSMGLWTLDGTQHVQVLKDQRAGLNGYGICNAAGTKTTYVEAVWNWFDAGDTTWYDELGGYTSTWTDPVTCPQ